MKQAIRLLLTAAMSLPAFAQTPTPADLLKAACGAPDDSFKVTTHPATDITAPVPGKAQLYFLQTQDKVATCLGNCGITVKAGLDGQWVGATRGTSHFDIQVSPGEHHLCVAWQSKLGRLRQHQQLAGFTAKPGDTLYFRVHIIPATTETIPQFSFEPLNADEGKLLVASSPQSSW